MSDDLTERVRAVCEEIHQAIRYKHWNAEAMSTLETIIEKFRAAVQAEAEEGMQNHLRLLRQANTQACEWNRAEGWREGLDAARPSMRHKRGCEINPGGPIMAALGKPEPRPCTCGRDAALRDAGPKEEACSPAREQEPQGAEAGRICLVHGYMLPCPVDLCNPDNSPISDEPETPGGGR